MKKYKGKLQIGSLDTKKAAAPAAPAPAKKEEAPKPKPKAAAAAAPAKPTEPLDVFGDLVPFADPSWYQGVSKKMTVNLRVGYSF